MYGLLNKPEGKALSDTELDAQRERTVNNERDYQAKDLTDSYGIGSAIGDALLKRAGFGTPIKNYRQMQDTAMRDRWARENATTEKEDTARDVMFRRRLHDGIIAVADPNSPFYGDLSYMQATVNEPDVKRNLGIQGRWAAEKTGKKDPNTGLPIYQVSDVDPKTGEVFNQTQATAQQIIDSTLGQMNPKFQEQMAEGIAKSAVEINNKMRIFNHFKDVDPKLAEFAVGIKEDPFKAKMGMFNQFMEVIKTDPRFKEWTPNDAAAVIFGKRMSEDRYKFLGTNLVEDPATGDAGLKVYDKTDNKTKVIPIDGYSYDKYKKDMLDIYGAKREAAAAASKTDKGQYTLNGKVYKANEVKVIDDLMSNFKSRVKALNDNDTDYMVDPLTEPSPETVAKYYELIKLKGNREMFDEAKKGDPEAKAAAAALLRSKGAQELVPLVIPK